MSNATLDQAVPFSDLTRIIPKEISAPLRPHLAGGHAKLFRYSVAAEKALIGLGSYNSASDTTFDWPNLPDNAIVDPDYAKVWVDTALLRYFSDAISSGDTIAPVASYANRIRAVATRWQTNAAAARSASLLDRDVTIGDAVYLTDGSNTLSTLVAGFVPEVVAAIIASATNDAGNHGGQGASSSVTQTAGTVNDVVATRSVAAYSGLKDGTLDEVYTVSVTTSAGTPGDATTARLSVTSSSGLDNQASVTPAPYGRPTPIGTRGATLTFTRSSTDLVLGQVWTLTIHEVFVAVTGASSGTYTGTKNLNYIVTVTRGGVAGATSPLTNPSVVATATATGGGASGGALAAGTYYIAYTFRTTEGETTVGTSESAQLTVGATNIPRVTIPALPTGATCANIYLTNTGGGVGTEKLYARDVVTTTFDMALNTWDGGTYSSSTVPPASNTATVIAPQVTAVDTTGVDASGPTTVPGGLAVSVGSFGVILTLSAASIRKGDIYHVNTTAAADGAIQTIILADNMPTAMLSDMDLTLKLYIKKNLALAEEKVESPPSVNWSATTDNLIVKAAATAYDPTWTSSGVQQPLPLDSGLIFAEYRAWLPDFAGKITVITAAADLVQLGTDHPDNPLCYAASKAFSNSNGQGVALTAVVDPGSLSDWNDVLNLLDRLTNVYGLVPLTRDPAVLAAYKSHVTVQSTSDLGCWRVVWESLLPTTIAVVINATTTSDLQVALGKLADDPSASGTQYTQLTCTTGNAKFITRGVRAGDTVRYLYAVDGFGNTIYSSFTVASVVNEDVLLFKTGNGSAVTTAQRFEIWRNYSRTESAAALAGQAATIADERVMAVYPGTMLDGSLEVDGWFLCAALAALAGGVPPHQSLRSISLSGFTGVGGDFNNGQLNTAESAGVFTVGEEPDGTIFVRQGKTTDQTSVETGQEASVRSLDAVQLLLQNRARLFYGRSNVTNDNDSGAVALLRTNLNTALQLGINGTFITRLGSLIESGSNIDAVSAHSVFKDTVVVQATIVRPFGLNDAVITVTTG